MKKPKLENFKREVYDGQDYADWYKEYCEALERYIDELEQGLHIHDVVGRSEEFICPVCGSNKTYKTEAYHCNRCAVTTEV